MGSYKQCLHIEFNMNNKKREEKWHGGYRKKDRCIVDYAREFWSALELNTKELCCQS
jgi:hypothetical protein